MTYIWVSSSYYKTISIMGFGYLLGGVKCDFDEYEGGVKRGLNGG